MLTGECWGTFCSYTPLTTYTTIAQPARAASSCEVEAFLRFLAVALVPIHLYTSSPGPADGSRPDRTCSGDANSIPEWRATWSIHSHVLSLSTCSSWSEFIVSTTSDTTCSAHPPHERWAHLIESWRSQKRAEVNAYFRLSRTQDLSP